VNFLQVGGFKEVEDVTLGGGNLLSIESQGGASDMSPPGIVVGCRPLFGFRHLIGRDAGDSPSGLACLDVSSEVIIAGLDGGYPARLHLPQIPVDEQTSPHPGLVIGLDIENTLVESAMSESQDPINIMPTMLDGTPLRTQVTPLECYHANSVPPGIKHAELLTNSQYRPDDSVYLKDTKFGPVSIRNTRSHTLLAQNDSFTYYIGQQGTSGFVFLSRDLEGDTDRDVVPAMSLLLGESGIKGYKQAQRLRIRQSLAHLAISTAWYLSCVDLLGSIVSDVDDLEGGRDHCRTLVNAAIRHGLKEAVVNLQTQEWNIVTPETPDTELCAAGMAKLKLVIEKP
jgi:hypothetical protein